LNKIIKCVKCHKTVTVDESYNYKCCYQCRNKARENKYKRKLKELKETYKPINIYNNNNNTKQQQSEPDKEPDKRLIGNYQYSNDDIEFLKHN